MSTAICTSFDFLATYFYGYVCSSDATLLKFLEQYLSRLEGPLALQIWGRFIQFAKEIASNVREFRIQMYLVLRCAGLHLPWALLMLPTRCLCVIGDKVIQTTAMDDKRIKKDLQEVFGKLLDACVAFAGRGSEPSSKIRRTTRESIVNGRSSPAPRGGECGAKRFKTIKVTCVYRR